ncbi:MAG: peptidylprolyl isomerase [Zymomonas mobilis subsp. pomaceae]|uniref:Parvulin-like PPIase n=1 Tax=Zymomonas mobilis subsp. pomaceae (strain ATCC 29192 / DSM 22645 / JCM 10191 / CCUG 17912 / NBRC 13757 / NCIMB 11200 / NRRL B-4491 / Barker I) TaxID=579138 RepID=F8ET42_ZYMMT|nr:peptidylprolyl isomerase [Zymomonas mobilis]AEI36932.1 PpiC-type peptidyl-prolyl cis-trans isomerase [Zymomonas mobilis subsp. pomaceae ATCC 29192]MDX5948305.1 peptidylprolyl isomerase [Zymomonas mobilis subsp. pomaceae]GEB89059.1 chaperone SurA [Zymomonas mobilis subsp. pomaceae]
MSDFIEDTRLRLPQKIGAVSKKRIKQIVTVLAATVALTPALLLADPDAADLKLPHDLTIFSKSDPNVHKATAIVNGTIITNTDIDQSFALAAAGSGGQIPEEERSQLRLQILRNLIDETLQVQEAKANDIIVTPAEINQTYEHFARNLKKTPEGFSEYLHNIGASEKALKRQIEGELAWRRLMGRRIEPFINVSNEEVQGIINRLKAAKGKEEYHVVEIFLSATDANRAEVKANATRIAQQILKEGGAAAFSAYARQYSEASTAARGGDMDWVRAEQLPDALAQAVQKMPVGSAVGPLETPSGFSIIALEDKREILGVDPRDAILSLKQLYVNFPPGTTKETAEPKITAFADAVKQIKGCGSVNDIAAKVGGEVIENDQVSIRQMPEALQHMMTTLQIGEATPPFGSLNEGIRVLVLCGRDDPKVAKAPNFQQIHNRLQEERLTKRATRYLRDLRRDAIIEYR